MRIPVEPQKGYAPRAVHKCVQENRKLGMQQEIRTIVAQHREPATALPLAAADIDYLSYDWVHIERLQTEEDEVREASNPWRPPFPVAKRLERVFVIVVPRHGKQ